MEPDAADIIIWLSASQRLSRGLYNGSEFEDEDEFEDD
jgi:hypothetical protein